LVEFYGCDSKLLNDEKKLKAILETAADKCKATRIKTLFHKFNPQGISGIVIIAESHISIHTWPEYNVASVDIYTCGEVINPWDAFKYLEKELKSKNASVIEMRRGILNLPEEQIRHKVE
jgi:S-adenosylmethionine decarboxylase